MRRTTLFKALLVVAILSLGLAAASKALATDDPTGYVEISLPKPLVGDPVVDGQVLKSAKKLNSTVIFFQPGLLGIPHTVGFSNIEEPGNPNFGVQYVYEDVSQTVIPLAGILTKLSFNPAKKYLPANLLLTCDVKNFAGEDVACLVSIDSAVQAENIAAGKTTTYALDAGKHTIVVTLVGANANLWSPASQSKTLTLKPTKTGTKLSATFTKAGHLIVNLDKPGVVGDWYLDGTQVGAQVASIDQWVAPTKTHKVEVKNLTDPAGPGYWKDASASATISSGKVKILTLKLKATSLVNVTSILGTWSGTIANGTFIIDTTLTITQPCSVGAVCGSFNLSTISCSGNLTLTSLSSDGTFNFKQTGLSSACAPNATTSLKLQVDGTLLMISKGSFGTDKGLLSKVP